MLPSNRKVLLFMITSITFIPSTHFMMFQHFCSTVTLILEFHQDLSLHGTVILTLWYKVTEETEGSIWKRHGRDLVVFLGRSSRFSICARKMHKKLSNLGYIIIGNWQRSVFSVFDKIPQTNRVEELKQKAKVTHISY